VSLSDLVFWGAIIAACVAFWVVAAVVATLFPKKDASERSTTPKIGTPSLNF